MQIFDPIARLLGPWSWGLGIGSILLRLALAALGARTLGGEMGNALQTIILASSVLYELTGPACAKLALWLSGSYSTKLEDLAPVPETGEDGQKKNEVELLIQRIQEIQKQIPAHSISEEEQEFSRAAEEFYEAWHSRRRRGIWR